MDAHSQQVPPPAPSPDHYHRLAQGNVAQDGGGGGSSSQSQPRSVSDSQPSRMAYTTDQVVTPPASDTSGGIDGPGAGTAMLKPGRVPVPAMPAQATTSAAASHASQLHHLSAVAAAQDRLQLEPGGHSRKRMADGEVKDCRAGSVSPAKGHARTTSAVSVASTTASTISDLSAELRTRLSYAMVKVNHGWQGRCLDEVESLASQAASPTSSTSTIHQGRNGSSVSPRLAIRATPPQMASAGASKSAPASQQRRNSDSSPSSSSLSPRPTLAPPATIQPSLPMSTTRTHPRRNTNPRYAPTMLSSLSQSASSSSARSSAPLGNGHFALHASAAEPILHSPHKNVREQDAIETLLFMSSPGHSANLTHSLSPLGSPGPQAGANHHRQQPQQQQQQHPPPRSTRDRHALPSSASSRRGLPSHRTPLPAKKVGLDKSPRMLPPPVSPMALDPPPHGPSPSPNRASTKQHAPGHRRSALSLPSGLGLGNGTTRKALNEEDIERMLDRAGAELSDSSDDEEIQLPPGRNGLARVTGS
ncbi:hypothetical protein E4U42_000513 [Claviceps africana]|uniref:Cyclin-dependent kinase n=1 Tax=Claviceps africana TaxID=83212 RepID=A0A8K0NHS7_9HYPO|nr:hypothetical protein E4U42_000513 [Claviceps africana]